ncbi:MAG: hypothetical protein RKP73_14590 [Candidatus Contendobacter sp.]|nr:hypothetical protein [Candidatus Contendobacter sp.]
MKINCISCGHDIHLDDNYDNYEGAIRCWVCSSMLDIRVEDGSIRSVKRMQDGGRAARRSPTHITAEDEARISPAPKNNSDPRRDLKAPNRAA